MLTVKRLDAADARLIIRAAAGKVREIGVPMCIALTDEGGNLVAFARLDGGKVTSITIAIEKRLHGLRRQEGDARVRRGQPARRGIGGRLMIVGGGLPIVADGEVVGGIGVSSGTLTQDREMVQAAIMSSPPRIETSSDQLVFVVGGAASRLPIAFPLPSRRLTTGRFRRKEQALDPSK